MAGNDIKVRISADDSEAKVALKEFVVGVQSIVQAVNNMSRQVNANLRTIDDTLRKTARSARDTAAAFNEMKPPAGGGDFFSGMLGGLAKVNLAAQGVLAVLNQIKDVALSVVMPGFEFTSELETARLSFAGMISSMGKVNGEAVSFNDALKYADTLLVRLNQDAIRTAANAQELVQTMQGILAPGLGQGMSVEQVEQIATKYVNIAKAMGLPSNQFVQEIRDLITGGIRPASSQIASAAGITDATLKEIRESSATTIEAGEKLADLLLHKLFPTADEMMNLFPKTFHGILSQIEEFGQRASKSFMDAFEADIKSGLVAIRDFFGKDSKEGFQVNPAILAFVDKLKEVYLWILEIVDAYRDFSAALSDNKYLKSTIDALTELVGLLFDVWKFYEKCRAAAASFISKIGENEAIKFFIDGLVTINEKLKEMYQWARAVLAALGKDLDVTVEENLKEVGKEKSHLAADARARFEEDEKRAAFRALKGDTNSGGGNLSQVRGGSNKENEQASKDAIRASQLALRQQIAAFKAALDAQVRAFKDALEDVTVAFKQNQTGWQEMSLAEAEFDLNKTAATIESLEKQLAATEAAQYKSDDEREAAIQRVNIELEKHRQTLKRNIEALEDVRRIIGESGRRGGANGSVLNSETVTDLGKAVAQAGNQLVDSGVTYKELVCTQLVAKSWDAVGLEDALQKAGIDTTGSDGNDMRDWVPALYEVAEKLGALHFPGEGYTPRAGDAGIVYGQNHTFMFTGANTGVNSSGRSGGDTPANYIDDVEEAYGGEFDAIVDFQKLCIAAGIESADAVQGLTKNMHKIVAKTEAGFKAEQRRQAAYKEALNVEKDYFAVIGDVFTVPAQMLQDTYGDLAEKLKNNKFYEAAAHAQDVLKSKLADLQIDQLSKNLEYYLADFKDAVDDAAKAVSAGLTNGAGVASSFIGVLPKELEGLYEQLRAAIDAKNPEQIRKIKDLIQRAYDAMTDMVSSVMSAIQENASWRMSMVNASGMTNLQKDFANRTIEADMNYQLADAAASAAVQKEREYIQAIEQGNEELARRAIIEREAYLRQEELYRATAQYPSYLHDIEVAGKQAIEDGLVTFLTDGINKAESLADALRDMAVSILQTLQRISAEWIARDIMGAFNPRAGSSMGYADGGMIRGAGTSTSDSIPAMLSNGEFVMRAAAVKKYGLKLMEKINDGTFGNIRVNVPAFSGGGIVGDAGAGIADRFAATFSPNVSVPVYIDGQRIFDAHGKGFVSSEVRRQIVKNAKSFTEITKRMW